MANTYYKYVDREVDSQVNWSEIGKSMTDMLKNEAKLREDKKAALDQATRDELKVLADQPTGESESARAMAIKYGDNASQYLRMQDQLLKSGQLKLADYMVTRQNIVDDTDNLFGMLKNYQAAYGEKMERYKNGESQEWELAAMETVEGFGKFSQAGAFIDPASGRVSMAMMEKKIVDGKEVYTMSDTPGKTASIATVKGLMQGKWNKFNTNGALDAINESIGVNIQTIRKIGSRTSAGEVMSVNDVLASVRLEKVINNEINEKTNLWYELEGKTDSKSVKKRAQLEKEIESAMLELDDSKAIFSFEEFETKAISQNFTNPWDRLSILTDSMGMAADDKPYVFVYSKEEQEADPVHNIYMAPANDNNGSLMPVFTEEQKEASLEFMRNQLRGRFDYTEQKQLVSDYQAPTPQQQWQGEASKEKKKQEENMRQWQLLRTGTAGQKQAAVTYFKGSGFLEEKGIAGIGFGQGDEVIINYMPDNTLGKPAGQTVYRFKDPNGADLTGADWGAQGNAALGGNLPQSVINKFTGGAYNKVENQGSIWSIHDASFGTGGSGGVPR